MAPLNKNLLFENISYLLEKQNMKIGELETKAGVSVGYISRTKDSNSKPGIDFIVNAAEVLNVDVNSLVGTDLSTMTTMEKYLLRFLEKLIEKTENNQIAWNLEKKEDLEQIEFADISEKPKHPLFAKKTFLQNSGEPEYPDEVTRFTFSSYTFGDVTEIAGDCYQLNMEEGAVLYFMDICKAGFVKAEELNKAKELWMAKGSNVQFLCSNTDNTQVAPFVNDLFTVVSERANRTEIKNEFKAIIDSFITDEK